MWETIGQILTSSNALIVLMFLLAMVLVAFILIKNGYINFDNESLRIGYADRERNIIKQQQDYVWLHLQDMEANIEKPEGYDKTLGQMIIMAMYIEYVSWISFNHLTKSDAYISVKQNKLVAVVNRYTVKPEFKNEEFLELIKKDTKQTIYELIKIREVYKDN
jgi:hypothetical protein